MTGPKSQNYGAAVDATHAKKAKLWRRTLTFPFEPKFLIVMGGGSSGILIFLKDHMGTSIYANFNDSAAHPMDSGSTIGLKAAWTANSVTWTGYNAGWAGNSGGTAYYICVG